jgi:aminoglycoside phosphotransferase (APT) family kinase protein
LKRPLSLDQILYKHFFFSCEDAKGGTDKVLIDDALVRRLITTQFPQWKDLPIQPVALGGRDNRTFHLSENMLVRLPSAAGYAGQAEKEQLWLPKLAHLLPLPIPVPLAIGEPAEGYPWKWAIYG